MKKYISFINEYNSYLDPIAKYYANELNLELNSPFDSGLNGSAFLTNNNTVIKITPSSFEANAVYKLIKRNINKNNKHIPDYYDIRKIRYKNEIFFAIHIELVDVDCVIMQLFKKLKDKLEEYSKIFGYHSISNYKDLEKYYKNNNNVFNIDDRKFIFQLIDLEKELSKLKIPNEDLHAGNLGYKSNNLAIFDLLNYGIDSIPVKCDIFI